MEDGGKMESSHFRVKSVADLTGIPLRHVNTDGFSKKCGVSKGLCGFDAQNVECMANYHHTATELLECHYLH